MSFLAPLYLAGAAAVALPVLFHLIRRSPRNETPFSSLMFLSPSPPRITRRSRIEHWFLLTLRGLALALLALAFSRPFWRQPAAASETDAREGRQVAILIDASASMRRDDLWTQAVAAVDAAMNELRLQDKCAVFAFDETLKPVAGFEELAQAGVAGRRAVVVDRLHATRPSWWSTHLGQAMVEGLELLQDSGVAEGADERTAKRLIVVSDMQEGGRLSVLGDAPWPTDVELDLRPVVAAAGNASVTRLADVEASASRPGAATASLRFRVANSSDATVEQLTVVWRDESGAAVGDPLNVDVPAGESRVIRLAPPPAAVKPRLVLSGDSHSFDNIAYFVADAPRARTIVYVGSDGAEDAEGFRYYLERGVASNGRRDVKLVNLDDDTAKELKAGPAFPLVVATQGPTGNELSALKAYVAAGGALLYVVADVDAATGLASLLGVEKIQAEEATVDDYALLGHIRFDHPLFAAMAGPRFNDFTQIRFWKYRQLDLSSVSRTTILAEFDGGDPAIAETRIGKGSVITFAAGWRPRDGQLARSWKFPLMLSSLAAAGAGGSDFRSDYLVNETVPLPARSELATPVRVTDADGKEITLAGDASVFAGADKSGVYSLAGVDGPLPFAVNLDPAESDTAPLPVEAFEQLGCRLPGRAVDRQAKAREQMLRDVEQESRQRYWQWLAAAALGVLIIETWLAGRLSRPTFSGDAPEENARASSASALAAQG